MKRNSPVPGSAIVVESSNVYCRPTAETEFAAATFDASEAVALAALAVALVAASPAFVVEIPAWVVAVALDAAAAVAEALDLAE